MILKIFPDKEKAKSILKMASGRESYLKTSNITYPTIIAENYYEIIKELATAILLTRGSKAIGENAHKELIDELKKLEIFEDYDIQVIQDLRLKRNKSQYEGKPFDQNYLASKEKLLLTIIDKLKKELKTKL